MNSHFLTLSLSEQTLISFSSSLFSTSSYQKYSIKTCSLSLILQVLFRWRSEIKMIRNDDIVEDFVLMEPSEQYSMHTIPNNNYNSSQLGINHQIVDNCNEQNCETIVTNNMSESHTNSMRVHEIGFYGWRKKCLYFFILLVTVAVIINAALTLWIIAVLSFSMVKLNPRSFIFQFNPTFISSDAMLCDYQTE